MNNQYNHNPQLDLIFDETNVTETNWLKSAFEIILKLLLVIIFIYTFVYFSLGILITNLSPEKQIILENAIAKVIIEPKNIADEKDIEKFNKIKADILLADINFPKTTKLSIYLINDTEKNAFCLPNGNIYITSALYEELTDDEMLTFIISHEMAHYKNRDHLKNIRHKISKAIVTTFLSAAITNESSIVNIADSGMAINELRFSRHCEKKADIYAGKILLKLYNNTQAGVMVLDKLRENRYPAIFGLFSTHPDIDTRIKVLQHLR